MDPVLLALIIVYTATIIIGITLSKAQEVEHGWLYHVWHIIVIMPLSIAIWTMALDVAWWYIVAWYCATIVVGLIVKVAKNLPPPQETEWLD